MPRVSVNILAPMKAAITSKKARDSLELIVRNIALLNRIRIRTYLHMYIFFSAEM